MRATLKHLAKMVVGYGAVQWAGPVLSLVLTPIITRILSPSDYGVADYILTIASAMGTLALFAQPQAVAAHFNDQASDAYHRTLCGSSLLVALAVGMPLGVAVIAFAPHLAGSTFGDLRWTFLYQLVGASAIFAVLSGLLVAVAQAALRVRWGMLFGLITLAVTATGSIVYIVVLQLGAAGMVLTPITNGVVLSLVAVAVMRKMIGKPSAAVVRRMLHTGLVLLPTVASSWVLLVADRLFLVHYVSADALGHYAIANKIASLGYVAVSPLFTAWTSLALSIQHEPDARERYANMSRYLVAIVLAVALALGLFATEILIVLTRPAYLPAAPYVGFLAYTLVFTGLGTVLTVTAMADKQLAAMSWTVGAGALVNILLNLALIPSFGVWGATAATVIGYGVPQVLLYLALQRRRPLPYPVKRIVYAMLVESGLLLLGVIMPPIVFPVRVAIKAFLFAQLPLAFLVLGLITPFELEQAQLFVRHRMRLGLARIQR